MRTQQNNTDSQLAITAYGLKAVTGDQDFALFGAVATSLSGVSEDPNQEVPSPTGEGFDPALMAPIPSLQEPDPQSRILQTLVNVIENCFNQIIDKRLEDKKHLLLIVIPASKFIRNDYINPSSVKKILKDMLPTFPNLYTTIFNADDNVTKHLQSACTALTEDKLESVIFAGSDSLIDAATCQELLKQNRLSSSKITNAVIPGEAAASIVLQKVATNQVKPLALVRGLSFSPEPNSAMAHKKKLTGLSQAIRNASQIAGQITDNIDCVIRNSATEKLNALEWLQTTNAIWPNSLPEQERIAYQLGELSEPPKLKARKMPEELDTSITLGEIGAASIPLSIVLACARFNFNYPVVNNCIVCEANEFPFRGAIFLENPNTKIHAKT